MRAKEGFKFIMVVTTHEGARCGVGTRGEDVVLVPIVVGQPLRGVTAWDSYQDVKDWMDRFRATNGEENFIKWMSMRPEIGQVRISQ